MSATLNSSIKPFNYQIAPDFFKFPPFRPPARTVHNKAISHPLLSDKLLAIRRLLQVKKKWAGLVAAGVRARAHWRLARSRLSFGEEYKYVVRGRLRSCFNKHRHGKNRHWLSVNLWYGMVFCVVLHKLMVCFRMSSAFFCQLSDINGAFFASQSLGTIRRRYLL